MRECYNAGMRECKKHEKDSEKTLGKRQFEKAHLKPWALFEKMRTLN